MYKQIAVEKRKKNAEKIPVEWRLSQDQLNKYSRVEGCLLHVPEECGIMTAKELEITGKYDAVSLLAKIHSGDFSAREVTVAFCKRAAIGQQVLNCLTEMMFDEAIAEAEKQDVYFKNHNSVLGPLHGLPIALKDSFNVKGVDSSIAVTGNCFQPEVANSGVTDALLKAGAIIHCKTNCPQSMMVTDTDNFTFGRCRNPYAQKMTASGSSGGSGALTAFRGALVSMATDIGGSIRCPAFANGCCGIKPSTRRVPYYNVKGYWYPGEDLQGVVCVAGPITTTVRDSELIMKAIAETEPWNYDPTTIYAPWNGSASLKDKLVIGVIREDATNHMAAPMPTVLNDTVERIKQAGHTIVEMDFLAASELCDTARLYFQSNGGKFLLDSTSKTGEPLTQAVVDNGLYPCATSNLIEYWSLAEKRIELEKKWLEYWKGKGVDVLLMPTSPTVPRVREYETTPFIMAWNVLDYPALSFTVGKIDTTKYEVELPKPATSGQARAEAEYGVGTPDIYEGWPIGLQLVAPKLREELLFEAYNKLQPCFSLQ